MSKLYHLQIFDVGSYTDPIPDGSNNLVSFSKVSANKVSGLPWMEVSSDEKLRIWNIVDNDFDESSDELRILDDKILAFRNLKNLKGMEIIGCKNLRSFPFRWQSIPLTM